MIEENAYKFSSKLVKDEDKKINKNFKKKEIKAIKDCLSLILKYIF